MKKLLLNLFIGALIISCSDSIDNENFNENSISPKENIDENKSLEVFNELSSTFVSYVRTINEDAIFPHIIVEHISMKMAF